MKRIKKILSLILLASLALVLVACGNTTLKPTEAPTSATTETPTEAPTEPTTAPTEAPTSATTETPTKAPTEPTTAPTEAPTAAPTEAPTTVETFAEAWSHDDDYHWHASLVEGSTNVADKALHTWGEGVVTTAATYDAEGVMTYTCSVCGATKTEAIAKLEHAYSEDWTADETNHWHACTDEGYTDLKADEAAHIFDNGVITTPATYEADGVKTYTCTVCGETKTEVISKLVHTYSLEWSHDETNHWHVCTDEGYTDLKIDVEVHIFDNGVITTPATYEADGVKTYTCTVCGETKTEAIPKLVHTYSLEWSHDETSHYHACLDEGYETLKSSVAPHTWGDGVVTTPATHESTGIMTYTCTVCGETKTEVIPKLEATFSSEWTHDETYHWHVSLDEGSSEISGKAVHTWDDGVVTTPATFEIEGVMTYTCTICGETRTEVMPVLTHNYETTWSFDATNHYHSCTDEGYTSLKSGEALHTWGDGIVTTPATYEATGVRTYTCPVCGATKTEVIPMLIHTYSTSWSYNETSHYHLCLDEGYPTLKADEALHTWGDGVVTTPATYEADGVLTYTCSVCGDTKTEAIPKLIHTYATTWSFDGTYHYHACLDEGYTSLRKDETKHTYDDGEITTAATKEAEGVYTYTCTVCGSTSTSKILKVPTVSYDGTDLSWLAVDGAAGYKMSIDGVSSDLGNVLTYAIPVDASAHDYILTVYTTDAQYHGETSYELTFLYGENLQASKNYNFETAVDSTIKLNCTASWGAYPYGNWSDKNASGVGGWYYICSEDDGNMCAKIPAVVWYTGNTTLKKDVGAKTAEANTTYEISLDVKVSAKAMTLTNSSGVYGKICGYMYGSAGNVSITYGDISFSGAGIRVNTIGSDAWVNIRLRYTMGATAGTNNTLNLVYWPEGSIGEDNYVLVDNIQIFKVVDGAVVETNVDSCGSGDFETFSQEHFVSNKWYLDHTLLIEKSSIGSKLVKEGENTAFCAYTTGKEVAFDMSGNLEIANKGNYKLTMKVKLGEDATNLTGLGFTFWAWNGGDAYQLVKPIACEIGELSSTGWTTITAYFVSEGLSDTTAINLYFYATTNNDVISSANNYVLFDDVEITKLSVN